MVYHAGYLRFAERARTEALRAAGAPHAALIADHGLILVVRRLDIRYLRPARLDDRLLVGTALRRLGGATVALHQPITGPAGPVATLEVELACVRMADGRPARLPARWRAVLAGLDQDVMRKEQER